MAIAEVPAGTLRAALYVRLSKGEARALQGEGGPLSAVGHRTVIRIETQLDGCRQHAERQGYQVAERHIYAGVHTAEDLFERPELTRLRAAVRAGEIDVVIVYCVDRLVRDQHHIGFLMLEFRKAGARLEFATEDFEDSTLGKFLLNAVAFAAEMERERARERLRRGVNNRVEAGRPLAGCRPRFGYRWAPDVLDAIGRPIVKKPSLQGNPETAPVVRRLFADALGGMSLRAIAARLQAEAVPTPTGAGAWRHSTVRDILTDPTYTGAGAAFRHYRVRSSTSDKKSTRAKPREDWRALPDGAVPALIDAGTFEAVQERLRQNKALALPTRTCRDPESALLRYGFVRCGYCGCGMLARPRRRGQISPVYYCGRSNEGRDCERPTIVASILDAAVWRRVEAILQKRDALVALGVSVKVWRPGHDPRWEIAADIPLDVSSVDTTRCSPGPYRALPRRTGERRRG